MLSGGVFQNRLLLSGLTHALRAQGLTVHTNSVVPCNDGGSLAGAGSGRPGAGDRRGSVMCLAVPCEVVEVTGTKAVVSVDGALRDVDLSLVEGVGVGDYLLVHAGFAIERWTERDYLEWKAMLDGTWTSEAW